MSIVRIKGKPDLANKNKRYKSVKHFVLSQNLINFHHRIESNNKLLPKQSKKNQNPVFKTLMVRQNQRVNIKKAKKHCPTSVRYQ